MRWVWIDCFEEFLSGHSAKATKVVSVAEDHLHELYPGFPMMPHSLIIEGMAQTGGILVGEAQDFTEKVVLAKIPQVEFNGFAKAGDILKYEVNLVELRTEGAICDAKVTKNGQPFGEAQIFFAHVDKGRSASDEVGPQSFVFTKDHLLGLLRMAKGTYEVGSNKRGSPVFEVVGRTPNGST